MRSRGFTLFELLVVLAILALVVGVASPLFSSAFPGVKLKSAARDIATDLRQARSLAILHNAETTFALDLEEKTYAISGGEQLEQLPAAVDVALLTARSEFDSPRVGKIRFFPDGSSTGGRVRLISGSKEYRITVDWLTGRISGPD